MTNKQKTKGILAASEKTCKIAGKSWKAGRYGEALDLYTTSLFLFQTLVEGLLDKVT